MCGRGMTGLRFEKLEKLAKDLALQLSLDKLQESFALSKQIVVDESTQSKSYMELSFIEWLEFLTRLNYWLLQRDGKPREIKYELVDSDSEREHSVEQAPEETVEKTEDHRLLFLIIQMLDPLFDAKDIAFKDKTMQQSEQDIDEGNNDSDSAPSEAGGITSQRVKELYRRQRSLHESDYE
jgi:hypothetical protein